MQFSSTKNPNNRVNLRRAVLYGLAEDGGLYMPQRMPEADQTFLQSLEGKSIDEIGYRVLSPYLEADLSSKEIEGIVKGAFNFDTPLIKIDQNRYTLETFHGPTLAFKDVGARFMARLMSKLIEGDSRGLNILVATSGDTGSAVANGFYDVPGIRVFVFYPANKISDIQEKQIATLGKNIYAVELDGTFDDCQRIVKRALNDSELIAGRRYTTANSINIARLLPQMVYYFRALAQLNNPGEREIMISVPSGNFGNLTAGLMAKRMGLKVKRFVAATNINDVVPRYLKSGEYEPEPSKETLSNAMDVGAPSNFERILALYGNDPDQIRQDILGESFTDEDTLEAIKTVYVRTGYCMDPHGAVGKMGLEKAIGKTGKTGIFLETAHPAKFQSSLNRLDIEVPVPERLKSYLRRKKQSHAMPNDYQKVVQFLRAHSLA